MTQESYFVVAILIDVVFDPEIDLSILFKIASVIAEILLLLFFLEANASQGLVLSVTESVCLFVCLRGTLLL